MASDLTKYKGIANGYSLWNQLPNFERDNPGYLPKNEDANGWYDIGHIVYLNRDVEDWITGQYSPYADAESLPTEPVDADGYKLQKDRYYRWTGIYVDGSLYNGWKWVVALTDPNTGDVTYEDNSKKRSMTINGVVVENFKTSATEDDIVSDPFAWQEDRKE